MRYYWTIDGFTFRDIKRGWLENAFLNANRSAQDPFTYAEPWLLPLAIWLQCRWVCDLLIPRLGWSNGVSLSTGSQRRKWILAVSKPTQVCHTVQGYEWEDQHFYPCKMYENNVLANRQECCRCHKVPLESGKTKQQYDHRTYFLVLFHMVKW